MIVNDLPALLPVIYIATALMVPLFGLWKRGSAYLLALLGSALAALVSLYGFVHVLAHGAIAYQFGGWFPPVGIEYIFDPLSSFVTLVVNAVAFLVILHSRTNVNIELDGRQMPYYAVVLLLLLGFNGIILTGDMFNLFVFIEISSLAGYGLIAVGDRRAPYAAFKYLILGTIGASFYLLGLGFIYFVSGTLNMKDFAEMVPVLKENQAILVALILMVTGIGIKMAIFPLHGWLPDAYTTAPSASSSLIAPIGTKVMAYVMIRLLFFVFGVEYFSEQLPVGEFIAIFSSAGIILGSVMAMAQHDMKRMLAYSSVAQVGYIGLGIGLATPLGFIGAVLHVLNHAIMKAALFLIAGNIISKEGHAKIPLFDASYRKKYPWSMAAFSVAAISMIGLPPMAGFFSKWYLALATIQEGKWIYLVVLLVSTLLNAVYFFNVIERVYLRAPATTGEEGAVLPGEVKPSMLVPTLTLAASLIVFGLFNVIIVTQIYKMMPGSM